MSLLFEDISENRRHEIMKFDCDNQLVNGFLKDDAIDHHNHNYCNTKLLFDGNQLVGFISALVGEVEVDKQAIRNRSWENRLPQTQAVSPRYPVIKILYIGVDRNYKRRGYGREMILDLFDSCYRIVEDIGLNFVYLESFLTEEALYFYNELSFEEIYRDEELNVALMLFKIERVAS